MDSYFKQDNCFKFMEKNIKEPLVSIAIPFFNSERFLEYSILSVLNQTYQNWELFLIDDNGTDRSKDIANKYAAQDSRIRVLSDGQNYGLAKRLNESIQMSNGVYYARMDDDDIMACNRIEEQVRFLLKHKNVDVVGSSAMIIDDKNTIVKSSTMDGIDSGFIHPTVMGKTEWFRKNPYNTEFRRSQDTELWLRTYDKSVFFNIEKPLLFYREFGIPSLKKNLVTHETLRKIYKNYKVYNKSAFWSIKMQIISRLKDLVYLVFSLFNGTDYIIKCRNRKPIPESLCLKDVDLKKSIAVDKDC